MRLNKRRAATAATTTTPSNDESQTRAVAEGSDRQQPNRSSRRGGGGDRTPFLVFGAFVLVALVVVYAGSSSSSSSSRSHGIARSEKNRNIRHEGSNKKKEKKHHKKHHRDSQGALQIQQDESRQYSPRSSEKDKTLVLHAQNEDSNDESPCTIWLAASSLKGHPGMGVFTTRHLDRDEKVLPVNDGLTIPLYSFRNSNVGPNKAQKQAWTTLWDAYVWSGNKPDHVSYQEDNTVNDDVTMSSYAPCYSSLTNHHCMLASLAQQYPTPFYDDALPALASNGQKGGNPGIGAFTYDMGRENTVYRNVEPGEELFLNYLYCRHGSEHNAAWAENSYMPEDFFHAREMTLDMIWKSLRVKKEGGIVLDAAAMTTSKDKLQIPDDTDRLVAELLPKTQEELEEIISSVKSVSDLRWYIAKKKGLNHYEDPAWVRANGMCLENYQPAKSTVVPQAGRGGIAQFLVRKGEIVAPAPLLQIMDKEALTMYKKTSKEKQLVEKWSATGKQLLLNYCFGHPRSTLLLCPQTNVVLLNHCSKRTKECGPDGPNAEIRWAGDWHKSTKAWLDMSLDDMAKESTGGLAFDVVALRDIQPGDEVFIDYGREWEDAWDQHASRWKRSKGSSGSRHGKSWITAKEANDKTGSILDTMITGNLRDTMDHPYLFTGCQYWPGDSDEHEIYQEEKAKWTKLSDKEILYLYADRYDGPKPAIEYAHHRDHTYWPCSVLKRNKDDTYTVRLHQSPFEDEQPWERNSVPRLMTGFPRQAIHYFVRPNMSDHQMSDVFRHAIGIPDNMFPKQWKNLHND